MKLKRASLLLYWIVFLAAPLLGQSQNPRAQAWADALKSPIDFWGKVVDQNGNPIVAATVTITVAGSAKDWDDSAQNKVVLHSDAKGLFSLTGKTGLGIVVYVTKSGYTSSEDYSAAAPNYFMKARDHATTYRRGSSLEPFPTADKPTIFTLFQSPGN